MHGCHESIGIGLGHFCKWAVFGRPGDSIKGSSLINRLLVASRYLRLGMIIQYIGKTLGKKVSKNRNC